MSTQTLQKWHVDKVGNLGKVVTGKTPPTAHKEFYGGEFPFITPSDIGTFDVRYLSKTERTISNLWASNNKKYILPRNAITYVCIGSTVGKIGLTERESITNQQINSLVADPSKLVPQYGYYLLRNITPEIQQIASARGAGKGIINKTQFENFDVTVPSLADQQSIADVLSTYDDLIENNTQRLQILERIAQAIYQDAFASSTGKSVPLSEVITIHRGKSYGSHELSETSGISFVNLKCIKRDGGFRKSGLKGFTGAYKDAQKVIAGDIVMAVTDMTQDRRVVARAARVPTLEGGFGVISMDLVKIEPKDGNDKDYIYSLLRWSGFPDEVKNHANGANVLHLIPDRIIDYKTQIVSVDQQKEFGKKVKPMLDLIDKLELKNESLRQSRDLLLPKLVTGEIEVSPT